MGRWWCSRRNVWWNRKQQLLDDKTVQPNFAAVIINGILYSTQYTYATNTGANNGIIAINLFTGQQLWSINTTNALVTGMMIDYKNPNEYGVNGPFLWTTGTLPASDTGGRQIGSQTNNAGVTIPSPFMNTTGTQWNMYDAFDGRYVGSIVNGSSGGSYSGMQLAQDDQGGLVGYYINNTAGTQLVHPGVGTGTGTTAVTATVTPYAVTNTGSSLRLLQLYDSSTYIKHNTSAQLHNRLEHWSAIRSPSSHQHFRHTNRGTPVGNVVSSWQYRLLDGWLCSRKRWFRL